jgi:uncharacterized damage-inducible protein DinB
MQPDEIKLLYDYNYWANERILKAAAGVSAEQYNAPYPVSHGSLRRTLVHTLDAEIVWRERCQEGTSLIEEDDLPTLEKLLDLWKREETAMRSYVATLSEDDLLRPLEYRNTKGVRFSNVLWRILVHVVNHGTQHRAESAAALTAFGHSPGDVDFILFLREKDK